MSFLISTRVRAAVVLLVGGAHLQAAPDPAAGKFWYEQRCARCHGSPPQERQAGTPNISGRSAERIGQALAAVPAMDKVQLEPEQILDVEAYLRAPLNYESFPGVDYSDVWYAADESGWGLTVTQRPNSRTVLFLYVYEPDGAPLWLIGSALEWRAATQLEGRLLRADSAGFTPGPFDPASVRLRDVGAITARFGSRDRARLQFQIEGRAYQKDIVRLPF